MSAEGKHLLRPDEGPVFDTGLGASFQRAPDGSVRIAQGSITTEIPPGIWASVQASMSARGETADTFQEALTFHQRRE